MHKTIYHNSKAQLTAKLKSVEEFNSGGRNIRYATVSVFFTTPIGVEVELATEVVKEIDKSLLDGSVKAQSLLKDFLKDITNELYGYDIITKIK